MFVALDEELHREVALKEIQDPFADQPDSRALFLREAEVTGRLRRHSVASLLALLDETYARTDWLADCGRIRCAVQVIAGSEDRFPTPEMSRRLAETIPNARLHIVQGGPHFPNRSHRAEVQQVIGEFLSALDV